MFLSFFFCRISRDNTLQAACQQQKYRRSMKNNTSRSSTDGVCGAGGASLDTRRQRCFVRRRSSSGESWRRSERFADKAVASDIHVRSSAPTDLGGQYETLVRSSRISGRRSLAAARTCPKGRLYVALASSARLVRLRARTAEVFPVPAVPRAAAFLSIPCRHSRTPLPPVVDYGGSGCSSP